MLFIATILWRMAKYILKTTQTFGSKNKTLAPDAVTYHSDWSKVSTKEKVRSSLDCLRMLVMKHFNMHNVWPRDISEPLTPKTKLSDNRFYMRWVNDISSVQIGDWGNVLIRHVCEWKHRKHWTWACPFSGVEFCGAFHFQKIIFLQLLQIWSSYCYCDTDQLWTHTQNNNKTECLKWILLTVKNPTPHLRNFWH